MLTLHFQAQLEETPRFPSIVIYYLQGCIGKVHPKTFMERTFSHCELRNTYQHKYPSVCILCNINPVQIDYLTQNFFHPSHIFSNVSTTMLPFFNLQNLGFKRKKYSRMCFLIPKHYLPHPTYCVTWEYLLELHPKDILP